MAFRIATKDFDHTLGDLGPQQAAIDTNGLLWIRLGVGALTLDQSGVWNVLTEDEMVKLTGAGVDVKVAAEFVPLSVKRLPSGTVIEVVLA